MKYLYAPPYISKNLCNHLNPTNKDNSIPFVSFTREPFANPSLYNITRRTSEQSFI